MVTHYKYHSSWPAYSDHRELDCLSCKWTVPSTKGRVSEIQKILSCSVSISLQTYTCSLHIMRGNVHCCNRFIFTLINTNTISDSIRSTSNENQFKWCDFSNQTTEFAFRSPSSVKKYVSSPSTILNDELIESVVAQYAMKTRRWAASLSSVT